MSSRFKIRFMHYIGGKSRLVASLLPLIPPHKCYVEVFGGGAQLLFAKEPSRVEIYNDIDGRLVNLFLVVRDRGREFQDRLATLPYSRRVYREYKTHEEIGDPVEDAVRFFYVVRGSFGGEYGTGWSYGTVKNNAGIYFSTVSQLGLVSKRLENVQIEELDFRECIKRYDRPWTLFFCDPPYYGVKAYKYSFNEKDHEDLAKLLRRVKGKWLLTYNDHPRIRHLYAGFPLLVKKLSIHGALVKDKKSRRTWDQLIIANYELSSTPQFLQKHFFPETIKIPGSQRGFKSPRPKVRS